MNSECHTKRINDYIVEDEDCYSEGDKLPLHLANEIDEEEIPNHNRVSENMITLGPSNIDIEEEQKDGDQPKQSDNQYIMKLNKFFRVY